MKKVHCRVWHLTTWVLVKRLLAIKSRLLLHSISSLINGFCLRKAFKHQPIVFLPARRLFSFEQLSFASLS
jgi:hypothetical protein